MDCRFWAILRVAALLLGSADAFANCPRGATALSITGTVSPELANYSPFTASPQTQTFSFTITNTHSAECMVSVAYLRNGTAAMHHGASNLSYDILSSGKSIIYSSGSPASGHRIDLWIAGHGGKAVVSYTVSVPSGQVVPAGSYRDSTISLEFFSRNGAGMLGAHIKSVAANVSDTVASVCKMAVPSVTNFNLSSHIVNGLPNSQTQSLNVPGVSCTAPATIKLTGDAMHPAGSPAAAPNFDNFINYTAQASLGGAAVTLTTTEATGLNSAASSTPTSGTLASSTATVSVSLVPGRRLLAGAYSSVLLFEVIPQP